MLDKTPPGRYRIIERDRRLVTIDTATGAEIGVTDAMAAQSDIIVKSSATPRSGLAQTQGSSRQSALGPLGQRDAPVKIVLSPSRANKIVIVAIAAVAIAIILIMTRLWPIAVIAFVLKPSRDFLWPRIEAALRRYLADGDQTKG